MATEYDRARSQLSDILNGEEFTSQRWLDGWLRRIDAFGAEWGRMLATRLEHLSGVDVEPRIGWLLPVFLGGLFLFVLLWAGRRFSWQRRLSAPVPAGAVRGEDVSARWWEEGEARAAAGDYREGIRHLFRAVLERLEEEEVLTRDACKSNREYREEVGSNRPDLSSLFAGLTRRFDRVRYGGGRTGEGEYRDFRRLSGKLMDGGGHP